MSDEKATDAEATLTHGLATVTWVDRVATITLSDPARRNCVSPELSSDVAEACGLISDVGDIGAVLLEADGPVFSAGGDLTALEHGGAPLDPLFRGFDALAALTAPTMAVVHGPAIGAGVNFALACDVIVAAESAYFESRFLDIGIHPGGGFLWSVEQRIGRQAAAAMTLFGERIDAVDAQRRGLIWRAVPDAELPGVTGAMARRAVRASSDLLRRTKATLGACTPMTNRRDAVDVESVAQRWSMGRAEFRDGVRALRNRMDASSGAGE